MENIHEDRRRNVLNAMVSCAHILEEIGENGYVGNAVIMNLIHQYSWNPLIYLQISLEITPSIC